MPALDVIAGWLEAEILPPVPVVLPSGERVELGHVLRHETRAAEPVPRVASCWAPNKPPLKYESTVTWAEFVIVRLLERHGWDGRWIKNWAGGREFCQGVGRREPMPRAAGEVFSMIDKRAASRTGGGAWDVFAWKDDEYLCIESKQYRSGDVLRTGQIAWLAAALKAGLPAASFAIVEYDAGRPGNKSVRSSRLSQADAAPIESRPAELNHLLERVQKADPGERMNLRDEIAAHGDSAASAMAEWVTSGRHAFFASRILERMASLGSPFARGALDRLAKSTSGHIGEEIHAAILRQRPASTTSKARMLSTREIWMASPHGPPQSTGPCGFLTTARKKCENEGRYERDGAWACSAHMKAVAPVPWERRHRP